MIVVVLARHAGIALGQADVFVNVAGGVRIDEPGADLAVALAIASAARRVPVRAGTAAFGEIGLTGRLRPAAQADRRLEECAKLGLKQVVAPPETPKRAGLRVNWRRDAASGAEGRARGERGSPGVRPAWHTPDMAFDTKEVRGLGELGFTRTPSDDDPRREQALLEAIATVAPGAELRQAIDDVIRLAPGRVDRDRRAGRLVVHVLRAQSPRCAVPATAPLRAREDGRRDHRRLGREAARVGERAADAGLDDPVGRDRHAPPHRRTRGEADGRARRLDLATARDGDDLFGKSRYQLDPIADVLAKKNQALGTLDTYRQRLEQVLTRLTALEFQNAVVLDDVLVVLQRAEMTRRIADRIGATASSSAARVA